MRLQDKAIIVTGSTTGIGEAIARRCVAEGARVLIHGRDEARGREVVESLGDSAALCIADLSQPEAAPQLVQAALDAWGKVDGVVNNAACLKRGDIRSTDADLFDEIISINVRMPFLLIKAALEELSKNKGAVINIGSINVYCGEPKLMAYSMSKGALMTMSRNLSNSLGHLGVRVNHMNVGWVLTPNEYKLKIADGLAEDWPEQVDPKTAICGRLMKPEEIATAAVYWLGDESRPISGSVVDLEQYTVIGRFSTDWEDE